VFVEFVGAAGVGKSFLAERVQEELRRRGKAVRSVDSIRWKKGPKGAWVLAKSAFLAALTRPSTFSRYMESTKRLALYTTRRMSCDGVPGFHIASDGIFHKMRALNRRSERLGMIQIADLLFKYLSPPDVVVIVQATPATVFARRSARGRPRDTFTEDSVRADVLLTTDTVRTVEHVQRYAPNLRVIGVDLEETGADAVAQRLAESLTGTLDT
jgi:hypothetical protein